MDKRTVIQRLCVWTPDLSTVKGRVALRSISLLLVTLLLIGCSTPSGIRIELGQPFVAMPARVETMGDEHLVIFTAPSGGWQARFDTERPMFDGREVFITITSPDPDRAHTQALVELRVLTPISIGTSIDVYARVKPFQIERAEPGGLFGWLNFGEETLPYFFAAAARPNE